MLGDKDVAALKWNEIGGLLGKAQALFLNGLMGEITQAWHCLLHPLREQGLWISLLPVYVFKLVSVCAQLAEMSREDSVTIPPSLPNISVNQKESTFCIRDYMLMKY